MDRDAPLGAFEEQVLLAVLRIAGEAIGMDVRREIEDVTGRDVTIGAVYATLDRLEEKDFVESRRVRTGAGPRRVFAVSATGLDALRSTRDMRERLWRGVELGDTG